MSKELMSPPGSDKLQTNPEVGGSANELKDPSSQLAFLKDYSTAPATYLVMVDGYVMTTPDIAKAAAEQRMFCHRRQRLYRTAFADSPDLYGTQGLGADARRFKP